MKTHRTLALLLGALALTLTGCVAPDATPTSSSSVPAPTETDAPSDSVPNAPPGAVKLLVDQTVNVAPLPPNFQFPPQGPPPGWRQLTFYVSTFERIGEAEIPTVRRVGVQITGLDNEGKPTLVNKNPWLYSKHLNTPRYIDLDIGPDVVTAVLQVSLFGHEYEVVEAFVTAPGQTQGLHAQAQVQAIEGAKRGIIILNLPIALV